MNLILHEPWTVNRFLDWEDNQAGRHEFDGTQIIEMIGGSRTHQRIIGNLLRLLEDALDFAHFDVIQEMRIDVGGKVRYPDISVIAGTIDGDEKTFRGSLYPRYRSASTSRENAADDCRRLGYHR